MSDCCDTDEPPIQNPHLGKPAYVTANNPCEIVEPPCEMQDED